MNETLRSRAAIGRALAVGVPLSLGVLVVLLGVRERSTATAVEWRSSIDLAPEQARAERRPQMWFFAMADRPAGESMEKVFQDPDVVEATRSFAAIRVDGGTEVEVESPGSPGPAGPQGLSVLVKTAEGDVIAERAGFVDAPALVGFLERARAMHEPMIVALGLVRERPRPDSKAQLAVLYEELENWAAAEDIHREIVESLDVDDANPRTLWSNSMERLARIQVLTGRSAEARESLSRLQQLGEVDPERALRTRLTEALVLFIERRVNEALALLGAEIPATLAQADRRLWHRTKSRVQAEARLLSDSRSR